MERVGGYLTKRLPPQQKGPRQRLWLGAKENNKAELFTARKLTRFLEIENLNWLAWALAEMEIVQTVKSELRTNFWVFRLIGRLLLKAHSGKAGNTSSSLVRSTNKNTFGPVDQLVRSLPFQGGNPSSSLGGTTTWVLWQQREGNFFGVYPLTLIRCWKGSWFRVVQFHRRRLESWRNR